MRLFIVVGKKKKEKEVQNFSLPSHLHAHLRDGVPGKLHRLVGAPGHADLPDDLQDEVLGREVRRHLPLEDEAERRGHFHEELARAEDEAGVGVPDARGELAEGASVAGVLYGGSLEERKREEEEEK